MRIHTKLVIVSLLITACASVPENGQRRIPAKIDEENHTATLVSLGTLLADFQVSYRAGSLKDRMMLEPKLAALQTMYTEAQLSLVTGKEMNFGKCEKDLKKHVAISKLYQAAWSNSRSPEIASAEKSNLRGFISRAGRQLKELADTFYACIDVPAAPSEEKIRDAASLNSDLDLILKQ